MTSNAAAGFLAMLVAASYAPQGLAQRRDEQRPALAGLTAVLVLLHIDSTLVTDGLSAPQVQTDVEVRLRGAGIRVLAGADLKAAARLSSARAGMLLVRVVTVRSPNGICAYSASLTLLEHARLIRDSSLIVQAAVWESSGGSAVGMGPPADLATDVREHLKDMADQLANAYLAANPKR